MTLKEAPGPPRWLSSSMTNGSHWYTQTANPLDRIPFHNRPQEMDWTLDVFRAGTVHKIDVDITSIYFPALKHNFLPYDV